MYRSNLASICATPLPPIAKQNFAVGGRRVRVATACKNADPTPTVKRNEQTKSNRRRCAARSNYKNHSPSDKIIACIEAASKGACCRPDWPNHSDKRVIAIRRTKSASLFSAQGSSLPQWGPRSLPSTLLYRVPPWKSCGSSPVLLIFVSVLSPPFVIRACGTLRSSALAVFELIARSNFFDYCRLASLRGILSTVRHSDGIDRKNSAHRI